MRTAVIKITSGWAKSMVLQTETSVRPTKNVVRQAVFDMIRPVIADTLFIDMFAGTGAVGIEALANGASGCIFVEKGRKVGEVLRENIAVLGHNAQRQKIAPMNVSFKQQTVEKFLRSFSTLCRVIAWADPPYDEPVWRRKIPWGLQAGVGSYLFIESPFPAPVAEERTGNWVVKKSRRYGNTLLEVLRKER